jgi:hypothetical protein
VINGVERGKLREKKPIATACSPAHCIFQQVRASHYTTHLYLAAPILGSPSFLSLSR